MLLLRISIIILICFIGVMPAKAQSDIEFWFAAPEVSRSTQDFDRPIKLFITTYGQKATVTISHPAQPTLAPIVVKIAKDSMLDVDLTPRIQAIESLPANAVLRTGLKITSTAPITVYYEVVSQQCKCNPEIFVLKGKNALGTSFIIPSQTLGENANIYTPLPTSSFDIVATQNNTTVTITPANPIAGHTAGVPFNVTLNTGEVYSAAATGQMGPDHLHGSSVTSDKPVAVTVKDDLLYIPAAGNCADLTGDQLVPVDLVGTEYIAINGRLTIDDRLFVTATQNNTLVYQDNVLKATLNKGQTHMLTVSGKSTYVKTTNPAYVLQLTGIGCELGSTILPAIGCTGSYSVSFTRSSNTYLFVNLLTKTGGQGSFLVNGNPNVVTSGMFTPVAGTGGLYHTATIAMPTYKVGTAISFTNTSMMFHLGVLHGDSSVGARFGYFSNYGNIAPIVWTNTPLCQNDTVQLNTHKITGAKYTWTGPLSFKSTKYNPYIYPAPAGASGAYTLVMEANGCTGSSDVDLTVNPRPILNATPMISFICPKDSMKIQVSGADSFHWSPDYNLDTTKGPVVIAKPETRTRYYIKGFAENECTNIDSALVDIKTLPNVNIVPEHVVKCPSSTAVLTASGGATYTWEPIMYLNKGTGNVVITSTPKTMTYEVTAVGSNGCIGKDSVLVTVGNTVLQEYTFSKCSDSLISFGGLDLWDTAGDFTHLFKTFYGCDSIVTLHIDRRSHPKADFEFTPIIPILNEPTRFYSKSTDAVLWQWRYGDGSTGVEENPVYLFKQSGSYKVCLLVRNADRCPDTICKPVDALIFPAASLPDAFTPNGDGVNDILYLYGGAVTSVHLRIYNRWGQMVFETRDMAQGWDGTFKGEPQRQDAYAYTIKAVFVDGKDYNASGSVLLMR